MSLLLHMDRNSVINMPHAAHTQMMKKIAAFVSQPMAAGASLQEAAARLQTTAAACASSLIEWVDGPLVQAMKQGDVLLIDELNLAEDAVLERLNRWP